MPIVLGTELRRQSQNKMKMMKDELYYIPLIDSLQQLLSNKFVLNEVPTHTYLKL